MSISVLSFSLSSVHCKCEFEQLSFSSPLFDYLSTPLFSHLAPFFLLFASRQPGWRQEGCHVRATNPSLFLSISLDMFRAGARAAAGELMVLVFGFNWTDPSTEC